ncbi:MAG: GNAT family N-acetyltransferase [Lachnospiraceae bacterium]|nr:GNAT family N-acetyltransferase [Lachnospiraceae bacterium]
MNCNIIPLEEKYLADAIQIWNEVVDEGIAFPQEEDLTAETGPEFFASQSHCSVAVDAETGEVYGLYILHPNNVGRCKTLCNASYAVRSDLRGQHIGEQLVLASVDKARELGFLVLQFNAVVETNIHAIHLYERLGFHELGRIPNGFRMKDGHFETIVLYYLELS